MHLSSMYHMIFIVVVIFAGALILFIHWRYKVWQRERLAKQCRDSAVIRLRTKSWQGFNCASSVRILKVDGKEPKSFLYRWPWKQAIYVTPGVHSMEVRADWPVRTAAYNHYCWFHYTVERLPEIVVEAGAVYALEYEVQTDTWSLFRLEKVNNTISGIEFLEKRFTCPEGYMSDNHLWFWNTVIIILWIAGVLFMKYG